MADKKISQLTAATIPLAGTEVLPIVQGSSTVKVAVSDLTAGRDTTVKKLLATETSGIGTANPTVASGTGFVINGGAGQTRLAFKNNTTGDAAGDGVQFALVGAGFIYQNRETGGYHSFEINGNEYLKIEDAGNVTVDAGNLVIGTSGKGINFSVTSQASGMTSELLADYEEGTWTPTDASGAGLTFLAQSGTYTKVGRLVTCELFVHYPVTASAVAASIGGLPYTSSSGAGGAWGYTNNSGAASWIVLSSSTTFEPYDNIAGAQRTNAQMSSTYNYVTVTYFA